MQSIVNKSYYIVDGIVLSTATNIIMKKEKNIMSCKEPRNLGCHRSGAPIADTNLVIPLCICIDELRQGDCIEFVIPCNFCYPECIGNVHLLINNTVTLTLIKTGVVKSDQICKRTKYRVVVGTEFSTATVVNCLPKSKFPFPTISAVATIAANEPVAPIATSTTTAKGGK